MASMSESESESSSGASASAAQDAGLGTALYMADEIKDIHELRHERVLAGTAGTAGSEAGQLNQPLHLTIDGNDNIYVCDRDNNRIQVISSEDGSAIRQINAKTGVFVKFDGARGVALDRDNNIMVADWTNRCVNVFSQDGNLIRTFGGSDGPGALNYPIGIASSQRDRSVYVVDSGNRRVQVFSCSGEHLRTIGGAGEFTGPRGIALDEDDNIYITDYNEHDYESQHRVVVMSKNGDLIRSFGTRGTNNGEFEYPYSVCVDQHRGLVIVGDEKGIQVFSKDGSFIRKLDDKMFYTTGLGVDSQGRIVASNIDDDTIERWA